MAKCSFCRSIITPGTGKIFAMNDGKILHFCANKCEKNHFKLGRKARFLKWTGAFIKGPVTKAEKDAAKEEAAIKTGHEEGAEEHLAEQSAENPTAAKSVKK